MTDEGAQALVDGEGLADAPRVPRPDPQLPDEGRHQAGQGHLQEGRHRQAGNADERRRRCTTTAPSRSDRRRQSGESPGHDVSGCAGRAGSSARAGRAVDRAVRARCAGAAVGGRPLIRIDSSGEDDDVERALLRRGEAAARAEGVPAIAPAQLARDSARSRADLVPAPATPRLPRGARRDRGRDRRRARVATTAGDPRAVRQVRRFGALARARDSDAGVVASRARARRAPRADARARVADGVRQADVGELGVVPRAVHAHGDARRGRHHRRGHRARALQHAQATAPDRARADRSRARLHPRRRRARRALDPEGESSTVATSTCACSRSTASRRSS